MALPLKLVSAGGESVKVWQLPSVDPLYQFDPLPSARVTSVCWNHNSASRCR